MKIVVFTLGCKVNMSESASIINSLTIAGHEVSDKLCYADIYVLNTCAVTAQAEKKSRQAIARVKKFNPSAPIIVAGCASENTPLDFSKKEGVIYVCGARKKGEIIDIIQSGNFEVRSATNVIEQDEYEELGIPASGKMRADIKIQDGCDNFCAYCLIPYLRGRERSRKAQNIIEEIISLNLQEAVLSGINISSYDKTGEGLAGLLRRMENLNCRIRLGSLEVGAINVNLLKSAANLKDFAPHFHLSLQSGCEKVLREMNRKYTPEIYAEKVELIRLHFPNAAITTDIIAGFPTETETDFLESMEFAKRMSFSDIHCFTYSPRKGTKAALYKDLPFEIKKERTERMLALACRLKDNFLDKNIGTIQRVLIEENHENFCTGYGANYIKYYIKDKNEGFVRVKGVEKYGDGLKGEIIK